MSHMNETTSIALDEISGTFFAAIPLAFGGHVEIRTRHDRGAGGMYLTVLGTSADGADGGQVGRGNRVNGLISLHRPMSTEAAAGKNPVSHVGKIYNLLAHRSPRTSASRSPASKKSNDP